MIKKACIGCLFLLVSSVLVYGALAADSPATDAATRMKSWQQHVKLKEESINVIREDPFDKDILYVGTELGVYCSINRGDTDGGNAWHSLCNHLPTTPVHDIAVHPREGDLVIGTHGRSMFVLDAEEIRKIKQERTE